MSEIFKTCPCCQKTWPTQAEFVADEQLQFNGYQADFEKLEYGMFFFTHMIDDCCSTMVIEVNEFLNLFTGTRYQERKTGTEDCPGYCKNKEALDRCEALCECAFVREVCHIIKKRKDTISCAACTD